MKFVLHGEPAVKKNSQRILNAGGRTIVAQSELYKEYEQSALWQIPKAAKQLIDYPVNVKAIYYRSTKRTVDKSNLENALMDVLVRAGVLMDDNRDIVAATDGSRVYYDKSDPRTEVEITRLEEDYEQWAKPKGRRSG